MAKGKGHILGSKPPIDPMEQLQATRTKVEYGTALKWNNRETRRDWQWVMASTLFIYGIVTWVPLLMFTGCIVFAIMLFTLSRSSAIVTTGDSYWRTVKECDHHITHKKNMIEVRGTGGLRHIGGLEMRNASSRLAGTLGRLLRAVETQHGLFVVIALKHEPHKILLETDVAASHIEDYLNSQSSSQVEEYVARRGGIWQTNVSIIGHVRDPESLRSIEASIRGAIPISGLKKANTKSLESRVKTLEAPPFYPAFYASGEELSDWLLQLSTELASEIGGNIPGEFVAPIRAGTIDYRLGVGINPETLKTGPVNGVCHSDLEEGLLVCGGKWAERFHVYSLIIKQLVEQDKRVLLLSSRPEAQELVSLHEQGIGFSLGHDFVMNPVDSEDVPRAAYVAQLKAALEVLAVDELSAASHLEAALGRAVALVGATLADVALPMENDPPDSSTDLQPTRGTLHGLDAIRTLHHGTGARAFYGTQTAQMSQLADLPLTIITVSAGSVPLDMFAWELFCIKLSAMLQDPDLVIILDEPASLIVNNPRYNKRLPHSQRIVSELCRRGPTIVSISHPSFIGRAADSFASCISLALRNSFDISMVSDLLGLSVLSGSMHSKARLSSRESSYLRTMSRGLILLVRGLSETCYPVTLDPQLEFEDVSMEEVQSRRDSLIGQPTVTIRKGEGDTLLDLVAGRKKDLAVRVLRLLERYEPLTEESVRRFISASGGAEEDVEAVLIQLEDASMILKGHESHSGVNYTNFRVTLKGSMALKQATGEVTA